MAAVAIAMPRLGMTMEEGTVVEWPIPVGGRVEKGETVLVIETEKAESEIEATASGFFRHAYAEPGETLPCGALLAAVTDAADESFDPDEFAAAWVPPQGSVAETEPAPDPSAARPAASAGPRPRADRKAVAPAARAAAKKLGVDPEEVVGTGPGGRVTKQDVEAFAAARERLVTVEEGVGLEVLREGEGDPVVLLPGFGSDVSSFALLSPSLAQRFEVIGVNPRGVGSSDAPAQEAYEPTRAADDVAQVLAARALDLEAHVIGASLGAAAALELAFRHPEKVRSLTLITPFVRTTPRLLAFAEAWIRVAAEAGPEAVAAFLAPWLFGDSLLGDERRLARTLRGLAQSVRRIPVETLVRAAAGMTAWSGSREAHLADLEIPTLVLVAGDDLLTPGGEQLAAAIPKASCEIVAGCGHALSIDGAEVLEGRIARHLA